MRTLSLFAAAFLTVTTPVLAQDVKDVATTLDVNAQVDVKAAPDVAAISAGVVTSALTAEAAMKDNATKMNAVFDQVKKAGIVDKDIQTSGININPQYIYEEKKSPKISGYQATNTVSLTVRDLKKIGPVLDALVAQGANQLNGPTFSVENPEKVLDDARKEAILKARGRAELYATATGLKIVKIRNISENVNMGNPPAYPMMAMRAMAADAKSTPVASGEVNLGVTVNVTYELGQ